MMAATAYASLRPSRDNAVASGSGHAKELESRRPAYLSKSGLAFELSISETTVDEMVRRGVIPRPIRLSSGCIRWRWETVDVALTSMGDATDHAASDISARVRLAIEAAKDRGRGRTK